MTFTSGGTTLCVATLAATSCHTVATLTPATYPVTAAYSGDTLNAPATATGAQFTVIKADTHITVTVSPASTIRGQTVTVSVGGLPPGVDVYKRQLAHVFRWGEVQQRRDAGREQGDECKRYSLRLDHGPPFTSSGKV